MNVLRDMYEYCIGEVTEEFGAIMLLGMDVWAINARMRTSVQTIYFYIIKYRERKCRMSKKRSSKDEGY